MLQKPEKYDKINAHDGWLSCPKCGQKKIQRVLPATRATALPVYCRRCKRESIVNIHTIEPEP